mmetsp:Transcript_6783/g.16900  ORF Transcript_6783/g.16900 Transcript_6783/m.16900 type:complete len:277 (-) Transcript_6783:2220-3050(-)
MTSSRAATPCSSAAALSPDTPAPAPSTLVRASRSATRMRVVLSPAAAMLRTARTPSRRQHALSAHWLPCSSRLAPPPLLPTTSRTHAPKCAAHLSTGAEPLAGSSSRPLAAASPTTSSRCASAHRRTAKPRYAVGPTLAPSPLPVLGLPARCCLTAAAVPLAPSRRESGSRSAQHSATHSCSGSWAAGSACAAYSSSGVVCVTMRTAWLVAATGSTVASAVARAMCSCLGCTLASCRTMVRATLLTTGAASLALSAAPSEPTPASACSCATKAAAC